MLRFTWRGATCQHAPISACVISTVFRSYISAAIAANTNFAAGLMTLRSTSFGTFPQPLIVAGGWDTRQMGADGGRCEDFRLSRCADSLISTPNSRRSAVPSSRTMSLTIRALKLATAVRLERPLADCSRRTMSVPSFSYRSAPAGLAGSAAPLSHARWAFRVGIDLQNFLEQWWARGDSNARPLPCQGRPCALAWENRAFPAGSGPHQTSGFLQMPAGSCPSPKHAETTRLTGDQSALHSNPAPNTPPGSFWTSLDLKDPAAAARGAPGLALFSRYFNA